MFPSSTVDSTFSQISQFDGNDTVEDDGMDITGLTEAEIYALDPELIETAYTVIDNQDITYKYTVNRDNQTKRLIENAKKAAYDVTYKDFKSIDGNRLPTNANVEFNAGVYMSAIKPALIAVQEGWKTVVFGTSMTCQKLSNRMDKSGNHLVCTQLTLLLTNLFEGLSNSKVVMHFYHTDDKLQIQGSSLLSRVSTAEWMVEHFIKPMAAQHLEGNSDMIGSINREILSRKQCCFCKSVVNHSASNIKDQTLPCYRCNRIFHKRCTDRRNSRSNWRKQPWFCQYCILNSDVGKQVEEQPTPGNDDLNTAAQTFHPSGSSQSTFQPDRVRFNTAAQSIQPLGTSQLTLQPGNDGLNISAQPFQPSGSSQQSLQPTGRHSTSTNILLPPGSSELLHLNDLDNHPPGTNPPETQYPNAISIHPSGRSGPTQQSGSNPYTGIQAPRFPTTSTRQRSSNVNVTDAEAEFNKTALNSCRSTITQQEAELKRLNECLVIRNKRILQLELQIGHASDVISSRDGQDDSNKQDNKALLQTIEKLADKISQLQNIPSTNIVVNSCQTGKPEVTKQSMSTQTQDAGSYPNTTPDLSKKPDETADSTCEMCVSGFVDDEDLSRHIQETHNPISTGQTDELPDQNPL